MHPALAPPAVTLRPFSIAVLRQSIGYRAAHGYRSKHLIAARIVAPALGRLLMWRGAGIGKNTYAGESRSYTRPWRRAKTAAAARFAASVFRRI